MEVEQVDTKSLKSTRYYLCRRCYENGAVKQTWSVASTSAVARHLRKKHGLTPKNDTVNNDNPQDVSHYLDAQHPLSAERWRTDFIN